MTDDELEATYKANIGISHLTALRAVFTQGHYAGAGVTPSATSPDKSLTAAKPAAVVKYSGKPT